MNKDSDKLLDLVKADDLGQLDSPSGDDLPRPIRKLLKRLKRKTFLEGCFLAYKCLKVPET